MIHICNIHCHTMDMEKADLMGIQDKGKWLPFAFHLDIVIACKLASDDGDDVINNCTSIFTENGDTYIIDTPYQEFVTIFQLYNATPETEESDDLNF